VALTRLGLPFRLHEYTASRRTTGYGVEAVEQLGLDPERTFKTLVVCAGDKAFVGLVPVSCSLDLKAIAAAARMKLVELASPKVAERLTGYVVGGISPFGQQRRMPTFVDQTANSFPTIFCSGGRRGLEIEITPADLLLATNGKVAAISRRDEE
jgi:Cys-tRNA(Pro)/Cys-tRNA(Cys) deacylase